MKYVRLALCLICTLVVARSGFGLEVAPAAGTIVSVKLADAIDSDHDGFGKQYQAVLSAPVALSDGHTIPAGSRATVSLIHNNSGWLTQLTGIVVNGRTLEVSSSAGAIIVPQQGTRANADPGVLSRIGFGQNAPQTSARRIQLASSTQLRFLLIGTARAARPARAARRSRAASARGYSAAPSRTVSRREAGIAYLCRAADRSDRVSSTYYVADVLRTFDEPALVERSWREYLVSTYPYRFANNPHATVQCTRLTDAAARGRLEGELNSENAGVIHTPWRYTLGTPPVPSANARDGQGQVQR